MVSAKMTEGIRRGFEELKTTTINIHQYEGSLFDVAFEILTADSFVAGVASKIIDGDPVTTEERLEIGNPLLQKDRWWRQENGLYFDLQPYSEVREIAKKLESLRAKCMTALRG